MVVLVITMLYVLDIIARTYITEEGIRYEPPSGKSRWIIRKKERHLGNGKNEK